MVKLAIPPCYAGEYKHYIPMSYKPVKELIEESLFAEALGITVSVLAKFRCDELKEGKEWRRGRYKKPYYTKKGQVVCVEKFGAVSYARFDEMHIQPFEELSAELNEEVEPVMVKLVLDEKGLRIEAIEESAEEEPINVEAVKPTGLDNGSVAVVVGTRFPNRRILKVVHQGEVKICLCRNSEAFVRGMEIPIRWDAGRLVAARQPRRVGKW